MHVILPDRVAPIGGRRAIAASIAAAAFTALCAQIAVPLPGHPVPITLQVFAVVLCGLVLGSRWGAVAQFQYLAAGLLGAPVFAMGKAGPAALIGPTGGYLIGFVAAAFAVGVVFETLSTRSFSSALAAGAAGVVVVYCCGAAWLAVWLGQSTLSAWAAWFWGTVPYLGADALKIAAAAWIVSTNSAMRILQGWLAR